MLVFSRTATWLNNRPHTLEARPAVWILRAIDRERPVQGASHGVAARLEPVIVGP